MSVSSLNDRSVLGCVGGNATRSACFKPNMIILLFHVLYLFGKFIYSSYHVNKQKTLKDAEEPSGERAEVSEWFLAKEDSNATLSDAKNTIRFFPPAYVQRYVAVSNVLSSDKYSGQLRKIVDFGCSDLGFLIYLKNTQGVEEILCVDVDRQLLEASQEKAAPLVSEYIHCRNTPLKIEIWEGSVIHNDKKLEKTDAVVCIELIEHLDPDTLTDLPFNIFEYIKPKLAIFTTPNADFNVLFPNFSGIRHPDHKFEWTREQFQDWAKGILIRYPDYEVCFEGICNGPKGTEHLGACTQMAIFHRLKEKETHVLGVEGLFKMVVQYDYPFCIDNRSDEQKILDEARYHIRKLIFMKSEIQEEVSLRMLLGILDSFCITMDTLKTILEDDGWSIVDRETGPAVLIPQSSSSSDYGAIENDLINNDFIEDWDTEPGPATEYVDPFLENGPYEDWGNEAWGEEPSIVIPLNDTMQRENTYLYNAENLSHDPRQTEEEEELDSIVKDGQTNSQNVFANIINVSTESYRSDSLNYSGNEASSIELSLAKKIDWSLNSEISQLIMRQEPLPHIVPKLHEALDFGPCVSISRSSTSPEPLLLETIKMDQQFREHSISIPSAVNHSILSKTSGHDDDGDDVDSYFPLSTAQVIHCISRHEDISKSADTSTKENSVTQRYCEKNDSLCSIFRNLASIEINSDNENLVSCRKTFSSKCSTIIDLHSVQHNSSVPKESGAQMGQSESGNKVSLNDIHCTSDSSPQFTSTPKVTSRSNSLGKRRKSLVYNVETSETDISGMEAEVEGLAIMDVLTNICQTSHSSSNVNGSVLLSSVSTARTASGTSSTPSSVTSPPKSLQSKSENDKANDRSNSIIDTTKIIEFTNCTMSSDSTENAETLQRRSDVFDIEANRNDTSTSCHHATIVNITLNSDLYELKTMNDGCHSVKHTKDSDQATSVLKDERKCECLVTVNRELSNLVEMTEQTEMKLPLRESLETPPNSWSPEVIDSGYPNSGSAHDMSPEYDLSSISQDHLSDSESASVAEAPRVELLEQVEVENGDIVNNNRDGEGNNMVAPGIDEFDNLQPLINVLENDRENDNDIYGMENGFPVWLLRILEMVNPNEMDVHIPRNRLPNDPEEEENVRNDNADNDEGFDNSSSEDESDLGNNEIRNDDNDVNENVILDNIENANENGLNSD